MLRASHPCVTRSSSLVLVATAVLLGATTVQAKDLCINSSEFGGNPEFRLFGLALPKAGRCRAVVGNQFADGGGGAGAFGRTALHGAACTPTSGTHVNLTLTVGEAPEESFFGGFIGGRTTSYTARLSLPDLVGAVSRQVPGAGSFIYDAVGYACAMNTRP